MLLYAVDTRITCYDIFSKRSFKHHAHYYCNVKRSSNNRHESSLFFQLESSHKTIPVLLICQWFHNFEYPTRRAVLGDAFAGPSGGIQPLEGRRWRPSFYWLLRIYIRALLPLMVWCSFSTHYPQVNIFAPLLNTSALSFYLSQYRYFCMMLSLQPPLLNTSALSVSICTFVLLSVLPIVEFFHVIEKISIFTWDIYPFSLCISHHPYNHQNSTDSLE